MLNKKRLQEALKHMPADATCLRVGRLWRKDIGNFDYVSFIARSANRDHWELGNQQYCPKGLTAYILRLPTLDEEPDNAPSKEPTALS